MAIEASVPESDNLLESLANSVSAAIGANASERDKLLRNLANDIGMAIRAGAPASGNSPTNLPPKNQKEMKSLGERYCDGTGKTLDLGLAGTFSLYRVFSCHPTTSNPQVAWVV